MSKADDLAHDRLIETLTIKAEYHIGLRPRYYVRGRLRTDWWRSTSSIPDTVYMKENQYHRLFGPAYINGFYDIESWHKEGQLHRLDGPAYRHKKVKLWYKDGLLHRLDGPAVDMPAHPKEYWIGGQRWSPKLYKKEIARRKRKGLI